MAPADGSGAKQQQQCLTSRIAVRRSKHRQTMSYNNALKFLFFLKRKKMLVYLISCPKFENIIAFNHRRTLNKCRPKIWSFDEGHSHLIVASNTYCNQIYTSKMRWQGK